MATVCCRHSSPSAGHGGVGLERGSGSARGMESLKLLCSVGFALPGHERLAAGSGKRVPGAVQASKEGFCLGKMLKRSKVEQRK